MSKKIIFLLALISFALFLNPPDVFGSEGTVEVRSTSVDQNRCFAASLLMLNGVFSISVSCRDLIYPPQPEIFSYVIWATPTAGGNPVKLGELGFGKARYETKTSFSNLFVTSEANKNVRTPSGRIVMTGNVQTIEFLDRPTTPTPIPEGQQPSEGEVEEEPSQLSTRDRLFIALRRAGIAAVLALVALIGLIFVITRSRG